MGDEQQSWGVWGAKVFSDMATSACLNPKRCIINPIVEFEDSDDRMVNGVELNEVNDLLYNYYPINPEDTAQFGKVPSLVISFITNEFYLSELFLEKHANLKDIGKYFEDASEIIPRLKVFEEHSDPTIASQIFCLVNALITEGFTFKEISAQEIYNGIDADVGQHMRDTVLSIINDKNIRSFPVINMEDKKTKRSFIIHVYPEPIVTHH